MAHFARRLWVLAAVAAMGLSGCGSKKSGGGGGGPGPGSVEQAFNQASAATGIPTRLMMATGYLESRLSPATATASYIDTAHPTKPVERGTIMTQTAFGLSYQTLGLDASKPESATLEGQIPAYAHWLQAQLKTAGVTLALAPATADQKFYWIENLALLHRKGLAQRRNVQILFARELIQILNTGFSWQDARSGTKLVLTPEAEPISVDKFPADGQQWFSLDERDARQIHGVVDLPLNTVPSGEFVNKPRRVEVIHCPLNLSACLELQTRNKESDIHLSAHYVIPQIQLGGSGDPALNTPLQVAELSDALDLTSPKGDTVPVEDAVIIMLVGNSGRMVDGSRQPAIPNWFTDGQLRAMAQLINDVCTLLAQNDSTVSRDQCMSTSGPNAINFHHQDGPTVYHWGDIPDYDPTIFQAYLLSPGGLGAAVSFDFTASGKEFAAGAPMPLLTLFDSSARTLELERLNRCAGGQVVWEPVRIDQVRNVTQETLIEEFHDSGPNRNGEQYLRLRVYGKDGHLLGWSIGNVLEHGYEADAEFASDKYCTDPG